MDSHRPLALFLLAMRRLCGLCVVLAALSGCASHQRRQSSSRVAAGAMEDRDGGALAEAMKAAAKARSEYPIASDDLIDVTVYQDRSLNVRARVDADGQIVMPLLGTVRVGGQTSSQAQGLIAGKLAAYIRDPHVALMVESRGAKQLFVLGEVQKPGPYPIVPGTTVTILQAITDAGGFTKMAAPARAHVLRYVDGKSVDFKVDVKSLIRRGNREKDMVLEPNDVVYVPQSLF